jgi:hypothetical protein
MDEREAKLPAWARELIANLRRAVQDKYGPLHRELDQLRPQVQRLTARNEALTELLECAARGGHATSQTIIDILKQYPIGGEDQ